MEKKDYIVPRTRVRFLNLGEGLLAGLSIGSGNADNSEVLSREANFDDEDNDVGKGVWED